MQCQDDVLTGKCESVSHSVMSDSWDPMDCSPQGSSVHGILQARMLECIAIPFSRGFSLPRDQTSVSCIAGRFFTSEPQIYYNLKNENIDISNG